MTITDVPRETLPNYRIYAELLEKWATKIALLSAAERNASSIWCNIHTSAALAPHFPMGLASFLDLGSGNGLPAIPLAIKSGLPCELIEADHRKAAFLQVAAATLDVPVRVTAARIEQVSARDAECITARALAPLPRLLPLVHRHLSPNGRALLVKGPQVDAELAAVSGQWQMDVQRVTIDATTILLCISGLKPRGER